MSAFGWTDRMWLGMVRFLRRNRIFRSGAPGREAAGSGGKFLLQKSSLLLFVLLSGALLTACNRDPEVRKQKYFDSGIQYLEQSKLSEAAIQFRNALKVDPQFTEAGTELGKVLFRQRQYQEAYQAFRNAIEGKPDYLPVRKAMATLYMAAGDYAEAQREVEYVRDRSPKDMEALVLLAGSQARQGKLEEAEATLNHALEIAPGHDGVLVSLASLKLAARQLPEAENLLKLAMENNPRSIAVYLALANFYLLTGRAAEAEPLFSKALSISDSDVTVLQLQARYYVARQDWENAEKVVRKLQSLNPSNEKYWTALADFYIIRNDIPRAKAELERIIQEHKDHGESLRRLVEVHLALGDQEAAEQLNDSILKRNPKDALAHLNKGRLFLANRDAVNALLEFNKTEEYHPDLPELHFWYAQAYLQQSQSERAKQSLAEALRYNPNFRLARLSLAELQNRTGAPDAAISNLQELLKRNRGDLKAYLLLTQSHVLKKEFAEAERILKAVVEEMPQNTEAHRQLGVLGLLNRNFATARKEFKEAWNLEPESELLLQQVVTTYLMDKQAEGASDFLQGQIAGRPRDAFLYHQLAQVYLAQQKRAEAIATLNKVLNLDPNAVGSSLLLAEIYVAEKNPDQAVRIITQVLQRQPEHHALMLRAAMVYEKAQRWEEARKAYERVLQLDHTNAIAQNNLAWLLVERGGNIDVALKLAQQAKEKMVDDLNVTDTIGWIYYKKGIYHMALNYLKECAEKDQKNPVYQYHLGMTYFKMGRSEEARQALQRSLKVDPNFSQSESARQILAQL